MGSDPGRDHPIARPPRAQHVDVTPWGLGPLDREHGLPARLWRQHRGRNGSRLLSPLLPPDRHCRGSYANPSQSFLDDPLDWSVGGHLRRAGRIHRPLPAWEGARARLLRLLRPSDPGARLGDDRDLVRPAALQRVRVTRRARCRWSRILGARRWVRGRCGAGLAVPGPGVGRTTERGPGGTPGVAARPQRRPLLSRAVLKEVSMRVNPFIRFDVDLEALTDAMWAFVTDPRPSRNERPVVKALDDIHPESVEVLESMLLDGTEERDDVAAYVAAVFGERTTLAR